MNPKARNSDLILQEVKDETLVYDLKKNKALCLNYTIRLIWKRCDGKQSVEDIRVSLEKQLNTTVDIDLVLFALDQLRSNDLIENEESVAESFKGMSRREVIRKVGLSAMISIPIISMVTAPSAANAQSLVCAPHPLFGRCDCPAGTTIGSTCGQGTNSWGNAACSPQCLCRAILDEGFRVEGDCSPP